MKTLVFLPTVIFASWLSSGCAHSTSDGRTRLTGSLRCRSGWVLPEKNTVTVALRDQRTPSPNEALSVQVLQNCPAWPVEFSVAYDPRILRTDETYFLTVTVAFDGRIQAEQKNIPVLTHGAPANQVEVWLEPNR